MTDDTKIYWEEQYAGLCGIHAINNLLQGAYFSEGDLAQIASNLDEHERKLMAQLGTDTNDFLNYMAKESSHVDEAGNFSIEVIKRALETFSLRCESVDSETIRDAKTDATKEEGYICNLRNHWIALRKMGNRWFNLNSIQKDGPTFVSDLYLSLYLKQLNVEGYSIFVVKGTFPRQAQSVGGRGKWCRVSEIMERSRKKSVTKPPKQQRVDNSPGGNDLERAMKASLKDQADDEFNRVLKQSAADVEARKKEKEALERALRESRAGIPPSPDKDRDPDLELALALSQGDGKAFDKPIQASSSKPNSSATSAHPSPSLARAESQMSEGDDDEQLKAAIALSLQKQNSELRN